MKHLRVTFEDKEFNKIMKVKDITELSWRKFILYLCVIAQKENLIRMVKK